jgi:hypothetical protein
VCGDVVEDDAEFGCGWRWCCEWLWLKKSLSMIVAEEDSVNDCGWRWSLPDKIFCKSWSC